MFKNILYTVKQLRGIIYIHIFNIVVYKNC